MNIKDRISQLKTGAKVAGMIPKRYIELFTGKTVLTDKDKALLKSLTPKSKSK